MSESTHSQHSVIDKLKDRFAHRGVHKDAARSTDTVEEAGKSFWVLWSRYGFFPGVAVAVEPPSASVP